MKIYIIVNILGNSKIIELKTAADNRISSIYLNTFRKDISN